MLFFLFIPQKKFFEVDHSTTRAKLKPGASSPGAKQYGDQPTNGRTKFLIEALCSRHQSLMQTFTIKLDVFSKKGVMICEKMSRKATQI
jgi:hypothetical protein